MTRCSCESRMADATKSFTGESSLTSSIVQTWAATTGILLKEKLKVEIFSSRLKLVEVGCKKVSNIHLNVCRTQQIVN